MIVMVIMVTVLIELCGYDEDENNLINGCIKWCLDKHRYQDGLLASNVFNMHQTTSTTTPSPSSPSQSSSGNDQDGTFTFEVDQTALTEKYAHSHI